jgi:hypothetical protein
MGSRPKSRLLHVDDGQRTFALVLQTGDDLMDDLKRFAGQEIHEMTAVSKVVIPGLAGSVRQIVGHPAPLTMTVALCQA